MNAWQKGRCGNISPQTFLDFPRCDVNVRFFFLEKQLPGTHAVPRYLEHPISIPRAGFPFLRGGVSIDALLTHFLDQLLGP